ncbi:MAG TPA: sulfate ABC transporter substrate-binding protein [Acidimicrobiales bacterium]
MLATGTAMIGGALPASAASAPSGTVNLVAYSVPSPAYAVQIKAFNKTKQGKNVTFSQSYGPSGSQAKAIVAGQPADVVNFASATDMETLLAANLVAPNWAFDPTTKGMVTDSVVVLVVPKGNPDHVKTWADLSKPGVRIFTPNPFSSGSARWNIMAAYGAELKLGKSTAQAQSYLGQLLKNTVVQSSSAANELQAFLADEGSNKSDVFLDYESDAIQAIHAGTQISYVVPKQTILIENPIAVTTDAKNPTAAKAFVNYLLSAPAQKEWAKLGYRPVLPSVAAATKKSFPQPAQLFTIASFGGWDQVNNEFFSTSSSSPGIVTKIESNLGQTT